MRTLKTLNPGQMGTKDLLARFGPTLLYLRYRCDEDTGERLKTVELFVQRGCPAPAARRPGPLRRGVETGRVQSRKVALRIGWRENDLQGRVKGAGGRWDANRRVWILQRDAAERLDLLHRVVGGGG